jgi:hypothetical protein
MPMEGELEVVDRERIVKSTVQKVRQKPCRNGAEMRRRRAATEA